MRKSPIDWMLWFYWIMATTLGWILGRFLFPNLVFITIGIAIGIMQSIVLHNRIYKPWQWIIATTLGWTIGSAIILMLVPVNMDFIAGILIGLTTGVSQWVILRHEIHWAGWWIILNVVGWSTGMDLLPGIFLTGIIAGGVTAIALVLLIRYPKQITSTQGKA